MKKSVRESIRECLHLRKDDRIVTAWCEYASGPGWANRPLWVIIRGGDFLLHMECLQPTEQTEAMHTLFRVCEAAHTALMEELLYATTLAPTKGKE